VKNTLLLTAAAVAVLSIAPAMSVATAQTAVKSMKANPSGTESTEAFITGLTLSDLYQIQAGKIAATKAQSQGVKDYANVVVADHTAITNQMKHIFAATKTKIPTELGPRGKRMIADLNAASPEAFDKLYLSQQQTTQAAELTLLSAYAEGGESSDIKPAAAKAIPKIKAHLAKLHDLQK
jgi:putative membrane protein